jgi:hypothetical protein
MRPLLVCCALGCAFVALPLWLAAQPAAKADADGWINLTPGKGLAGWKRVPIAPDEKLGPKNPWSVNEKAGLLFCDGTDVKEMLLYDREQADGAFHVEWRFRKVEGKPAGYNSGVYVRTRGDGKVWHQAQVAMQEKPPFVADLFGETLVDGKTAKVQVLGAGHKHVRPLGEWNTFDITCKGKTITVSLNDTVVTTWNECQVPKGHVGLQSEYWPIEFRNLKFRPAK